MLLPRLSAILALLALGAPALAQETVRLIGDVAVDLPEQDGALSFLPQGFDGKPCVRVGAQQRVNSKLCDVGLTGASTVSWSWRKEGGKCCMVQLLLINDVTGQTRWFGYCAGEWTEPPSADPTVEVFVGPAPPHEWTHVERPLTADVRSVLGWQDARVVGLALSPWDEGTGWFADLTLADVVGPETRKAQRAADLRDLIAMGRGDARDAARLRRSSDRRVEFEYAFEECAPGRNSHVNEWGAFGAAWGPVQAMGRRLRVRYPLCDVVFLGRSDGRPVVPMQLDSFRLGLVDHRLPAVTGWWEQDGVGYRVTAMTAPDDDGAYDLYKLELSNPSALPRTGTLIAALDGPPDMHLDGAAVRAMGTVLAVASAPEEAELELRDFGLCDRRALGYHDAPCPGGAEPAFGRRRLAQDGAAVVYRAKARLDERYAVFLGGSTYGPPGDPGQLVHDLVVEGAEPQRFDYATLAGQDRPMLARFDGAHDANGDGYIEMSCRATAGSQNRDAFLNVIYVFPANVADLSPEDVWRGKRNGEAVHHIDVGLTPEMGWANDEYDLSDVGLGRLSLRYDVRLAPGETATRWLKVPPIHRREMLPYNIRHHAFAQVLPGEGIPPWGEDRVAALAQADPAAAEAGVEAFWERFYSAGMQIDTPSDTINDLYYAQLGAFAIHLCRLSTDVAFVACGPFNYYDFAYRDHAYQVHALNLAGRHNIAAQVTKHYLMRDEDIPDGPLSFANLPLTLGQRADGLWFHRPGQWDAQGQTLWCLIEQWKLSGDDTWLKRDLYPVVRRAAEWIIRARAEHKARIGDPDDPRYGLFPGGAMEVGAVEGEGEHLYYLSAWGVFGMQLAAEAAWAAGEEGDARRFEAEWRDFGECLTRSYEKTFAREDLYRGVLASSVETEHLGMAGMWTFTPLVYPCRVMPPHDPLAAATFRRMESYARQYGSGLSSEGPGSFWPYISVDWGISYILRGEPDRAVDVFCAYVDNAGPTMGWAEGYSSAANVGGGDQPHGWATAQYIHFLRSLLVMEEGDVLHIAPATFRSWLAGTRPVRVTGAPTHFGTLTYTIQPEPNRGRVRAEIELDARTRPRQIVLHLRMPEGRTIRSVEVNGKRLASFLPEAILIDSPPDHLRIEARVK